MKYNTEFWKNIILDFIKEQYDPHNRGYINWYHVMPNSEDIFACILLGIAYIYGIFCMFFTYNNIQSIFEFINFIFIIYSACITLFIILVILYKICVYLSDKVEIKCDELFDKEIKFK